MNRKINIIVLLINSFVFSQTKTIENINTFDFRDFGTLTNNSSLSHYSFLITNKVLENKQREGVLTFYNEDLSETKKENFVLNAKSNTFLQAKNNGTNVIVVFEDRVKELITFKVYSSGGDLINSKELKIENKYFDYKAIEKIGDFSLTYAIKNKGFLISEEVKKKRSGYNIHFLGDDKSKNWIYQSPPDHNNRKSACPMFANEEMAVIMEKEWGSVYDRQPTFTAIALDMNTGKELFRVSHEYETTPNYYTKATVNQKGDVFLFGENYNLGNNYPDNDYPNGYFIEKYSKKGELINSQVLSFKDSVFKTSLEFKIEAKQKAFGNVFFYDVLESNGHFFAIGEIARRDKQGFTLAKAVTSYAIGGVIGGLISNNWDTKYTMENMVVVELDENLKLVTTH
ncbi:DUF6770 family protein [Flavobacterium sp.]|uniref:DUF6770 family protein n=1 Tax=Flavobacterium sp. TaxID=239 RepID=UPI00286DFC7D|nr:DUF6770 family protein [Flavobacterium sp.]